MSKLTKIFKYVENKGYEMVDNTHEIFTEKGLKVFTIYQDGIELGSIFLNPNNTMYMTKYFLNSDNEVRSKTSLTFKSQEKIIDFFENYGGHCQFKQL